MKTNYHTHTRWCRHANGEIEEVILKAIEKGYDEFGISEHVPYPNFYDSRIYLEEMDEFIKDFNNVIEKYGDKIKIFKGLECEYFEEYHDFYLDLVNKYEIDYLALGQHYTTIEKEVDFFFVKNDEEIEKYEKALIKGMESRMFSFIAHPDVFLARYPFTEQAKKTTNAILSKAQELNIPLEINGNGARKKIGYPNKNFWQESLKYNLTYIVNLDAHSLEYIGDSGDEDAYLFAKKLGINITEKIKFKEL